MRGRVACLALTLTCLAAARPAAAAKECAPLGAPPGYEADADAVTYAFSEFEMTTRTEDGGSRPVKVAGAACRASYALKPGTEPMSDFEIQSKYRDALDRLGADILWTDNRGTTARMAVDGQETWLSVYSDGTSIEAQLVRRQPHAHTLLGPSGPDYRLAGRMPGYAPEAPETRGFGELAFTVQRGGDTLDVTVQGMRYAVAYRLPPGAPAASDADIQANYREAAEAAGGQVLYADGRLTTARFETGGRMTWLSVSSSEDRIEVRALEEGPPRSGIEPPDGDALRATLEASGHAALQVPFDPRTSALEPEAAPVIAQVVKLMRDDPGLKLSVEGHTDGFGPPDRNITESFERARAVTSAMVAAGVGATRLSAAGRGGSDPLADDATAEGRAANRRVELVRRR